MLEYFNKKYKIEVLDATNEKLQKMGKVKGLSLEGISLNITKAVIINKNNIIIDGYKDKGIMAGVGVKSKITFMDGKWVIESSDMLWIS